MKMNINLNMMNNTKAHAQLELRVLYENNKGKEDELLIGEFFPEILAICEKFGDSGQSGGSAPYVAKHLAFIIEKLCLQKPISPISGIPEEWTEVYITPPKNPQIFSLWDVRWF